MPDDLRERLELRAGHLEALAVSPRTLAPDGVGTVTAGYLGLREALAALDAKDAEIGRLREALVRLGSMEAFEVGGVVDLHRDAELLARIHYAREQANAGV